MSLTPGCRALQNTLGQFPLLFRGCPFSAPAVATYARPLPTAQHVRGSKADRRARASLSRDRRLHRSIPYSWEQRKRLKAKLKLGQVSIPKEYALGLYDILARLKDPTNGLPGNRQRQLEELLSDRVFSSFAATTKVMTLLADRIPSFRPSSVMEYGCGVGEGLWAAEYLYQLARASAVILKEEESAIAGELAKCSPTSPDAFHVSRHIGQEGSPYDLVLCNRMLAPYDGSNGRHSLEALIQLLWERTGDILVFIEDSKWEGFDRILNMRQMVQGMMKDEVKIIAPCPHGDVCPLTNAIATCGFSNPYVRFDLTDGSKVHKAVFPELHHDTKFSFVAFQKQIKNGVHERAVDKPYNRVLVDANKRGKQVMIDYCTPTRGIERLIFSKSQGRLFWGVVGVKNGEPLGDEEPKSRQVLPNRLRPGSRIDKTGESYKEYKLRVPHAVDDSNEAGSQRQDRRKRPSATGRREKNS